MALWKAIKGVLNPISIREFKGVNKLDAFSISDGQFTSIKNMTASKYPAMTIRPGTLNIGANLTATILGLGVWKNEELHVIDDNGNWVKLLGDGNWGTTLESGLSAGDMWSFCNFKGNLSDINLIGANGSDPIKRYDGTNVSDLSGAPAGGNFIEQHDNRLYCAVENTVHFSALSKADDWTTVDDSGQIVAETQDGEEINGLKAGPGHLIVFKPHAIFELYGTGPINYDLTPVSEKIGCVSNASAVMVGGVLYFLSHRGIERYSGGLSPDNDFCLPVQWYLNNINATNRHKSCAGTDGKNLYMAIPLLTATEPSHILEYDTTFNVWYVWEMGNYPRIFTNFKEDFYYGDSAGQVHKFGGATDAGTAVSWHAISKPFGAGNLAQRRQWYNMWFVVDLPVGSTLNTYLSADAEGDSSWKLVKSLTAQSSIQDTRVIIPVNTVANANWIRYKLSGTGPCTVHEVIRQERILPWR